MRHRPLGTALATTLVVVAGSLVATGATASYASTSTRPVVTQRATPVERVQKVTVAWKGNAKRRTYSKRAVVPGIGQLAIVCRPDATSIRLIATDPTVETQLWMAKYQDKGGQPTVATKTARIYRYANPDDDGTGGTGRSASEGLNRLDTIENYSSGYLDGIVSQRAGRQRSGLGFGARPVTSLKLSWWWTGFRHPMSWRACRIDAELRTRFDIRMGITWHGDDDPAPDRDSWMLPGLGRLSLACDRDEADQPDRDEQQTVTLTPSQPNARVWVEYVTGEGRVDDHVDAFTLERDDETGDIGPLDLPRNGMMRLYFQVGAVTRSFIVSSYWVTNDAQHPQLNLCEVSVAHY